jgi:hypothetical protein
VRFLFLFLFLLLGSGSYLAFRHRYTLFWNITYVLSSDPAQANKTYCGGGPFSSQSWVLNSTVQVVDEGSRFSETITQRDFQLPTEPTGLVKSGAMCTGDLLHNHITQGTELGRLAEGIMKRGELLPKILGPCSVDVVDANAIK